MIARVAKEARVTRKAQVSRSRGSRIVGGGVVIEEGK